MADVELMIDNKKDDSYDIYTNLDNSAIPLVRRLEKNAEEYELLSADHAKNEKYYTKLFYAFGFVQVVFVTIATTFSGAAGIDGSGNTLNLVAFWFGLTATIFSIVTTFFKLEERAGRHHVSHSQYDDLFRDLDNSLLEQHDERSVEEWITLYNEKEKFINAYEPNKSGSCLYGCISGNLRQPEQHHYVNNGTRISFLENVLKKNLTRYKYTSQVHSFNEEMYEYLYVSFHLPQLLFTGVLTFIMGFSGFGNGSGGGNPYIWAAFILSAIATAISIVRTVLKFQKEASLHHSARGQFSDLNKDLVTKLRLGFSNLDDITDTLTVFNEKVKFINAYAPHFNRCV